MSKSIDARIECPFYFEEEDDYIQCEGLLNKTTCKHHFATIEKKKEYMNSICAVNNGKKCLHYRALHTQYDLGLR